MIQPLNLKHFFHYTVACGSFMNTPKSDHLMEIFPPVAVTYCIYIYIHTRELILAFYVLLLQF